MLDAAREGTRFPGPASVRRRSLDYVSRDTCPLSAEGIAWRGAAENIA
jgi:hypothetical protein